jgi:hypothetical protein
MTQRKKPAQPAKPPQKMSAMDRMIEECVKKAKARKKSGQTDREWREGYAASLKVDGKPVELSQTPFAGDTLKKRS